MALKITRGDKTQGPDLEKLKEICPKTANPMQCIGVNNETGNRYNCSLLKECKREYKRKFGYVYGEATTNKPGTQKDNTDPVSDQSIHNTP